ncbi:hypothetical protein SERLA73DRAFT_79304 [Serpula lacrymans var. lacrymans S7.3]|uniref:Hydrophobin n=2 Tax=Serpula lacrymans var. lacrymans TaxID=341189 RepID=F8QFY3_SERL3|nr:hydrophobin [Serpula lacrymans var. lacrymans S7.9]EGN92731.1 hypothetical protein SERLA73DRAFT_79304 [Serpula lacrymans var. lacrymans S7.3]EGO26392.1 hydrophobin [Serpula lacrymans var. lacrymans S7.9]
MFAKAAFVFTALAAVATARSVTHQCNTGPVQCCNTLTTASNSQAAGLIQQIGLSGIGANIPVGLDCNPITAIGVGSGSTCSANPTCCTNVYTNGLGVDCNPINVNL